MNNKTLVILAAVIFLYQQAAAQNNSVKAVKEKAGNICLEVRRISNNDPGDSLQVSFILQKMPGTYRKWHTVKQPLIQGRAKWTYNATGPSLIRMPFLSGGIAWFSEVGDSIIVTMNGDDVQFSGRGAEKFSLEYAAQLLRSKMKMTVPTKGHLLATPLTLEKYFAWINWVNECERQLALLLSSYQNKVPDSSLKLIGDRQRSSLASNLSDAFSRLYRLAYDGQFKMLTLDDLCNIYDSTIARKIERWYPYSDGYLGEVTLLKTRVDRKYRFDYFNQPLVSKLNKRLLYYEEGLELFKNYPLTREYFLVHMFTEEFLPDVAYTPKIKELLDKYYAEPGYPEMKAYVKEYEALGYRLLPEKRAPEYSLTNTEGKTVTNKDFAGKIVLMDFWFTGCVGCIDMVPALKKIEHEFEGDTNVVFLSISADKDKTKWLKSIAEKKYTTGTATNLYTNGKGMDDYMLSAFMISSYPTLFLLDGNNRIIENPLPSPRKDNGGKLLGLMRRKRALMNDGPYIVYQNDSLASYTMSGNSMAIDKKALSENKQAFAVQTDEYGKSFTVMLNKHLQNETAEFSKPGKLLALSDLEGNFDALRKLLQSNKVIDENYNWTFGNGHLVFNGDMFDRGEQVTECLWLIYSLEEKAKAQGGYVHFILGNHEIMNLQGDHRYVQKKYIDNAGLMGTTLTEMYGRTTELGRWLRTKNVVEKIGDILVCHAGISPELSGLNISIPRINQLAMLYYDKSDKEYKEAGSNMIMSNNAGPFWYRGYYNRGKDKAVEAQVDSILRQFNVSRIITGHTIVADTISVHYGGKVINTDTHHAEDKREALLIEGDHFYSVNDEGERKLLFIDNNKK